MNRMCSLRLIQKCSRKRFLGLCAGLLFIVSGCGGAGNGGSAESPPASTSEEERAIRQAVDAAYDAYSFDRGNNPSVGDILRHFAPDAQLTFLQDDSLISTPAEAYFARWSRNLEEQGVELLLEQETYGETEWFGSIAHRISAVEWFVNTTDSVAGRGVISVQLVKLQDQWLVQSMAWDVAMEDQPIPERYVE